MLIKRVKASPERFLISVSSRYLTNAPGNA
jgi:hypothetical protein